MDRSPRLLTVAEAAFSVLLRMLRPPSLRVSPGARSRGPGPGLGPDRGCRSPHRPWARQSGAGTAQTCLSWRAPPYGHTSRHTPSRVMPSLSATAALRPLSARQCHSARCSPPGCEGSVQQQATGPRDQTATRGFACLAPARRRGRTRCYHGPAHALLPHQARPARTPPRPAGTAHPLPPRRRAGRGPAALRDALLDILPLTPEATDSNRVWVSSWDAALSDPALATDYARKYAQGRERLRERIAAARAAPHRSRRARSPSYSDWWSKPSSTRRGSRRSGTSSSWTATWPP